MTAWVLTANRLADGRVVFLGARGWSERIAEATLARTDEERRALGALGAQSEAACEVVGAELIEVELATGAPVPVQLREHIRATGPTIRLPTGRGRNLTESDRVPL